MTQTNRKWKALIVDDEDLARSDLADIIAAFDEVEIAGEADSLQAARAALRKYKPDLVFLDIQLPGESGFDLLKDIPASTHIIFVTAFDEFAIRAFEVNARDYLLKPVSRERLALCLENLQEVSGEPDAEKKLQIDDRLFLKLDSHYAFLAVDEIVAIVAADDYSEIITRDGQRRLTHVTVKHWESRLPEQHFCRIHRSSIVNMGDVERIEPWYNQAHRVTLRHLDKPLVMSRRYFSMIRERMG